MLALPPLGGRIVRATDFTTGVPVPVTQSVTTEAQIARLEDRITRLERLLHSTVGLLHTLIERDQRNRRSG